MLGTREMDFVNSKPCAPGGAHHQPQTTAGEADAQAPPSPHAQAAGCVWSRGPGLLPHVHSGAGL